MQKVVDRRGDLDFIKGVLIFIVIWGHVCPNSSGMEYTFSWCALARITSLFAMPLFFMISGYFLKPCKSFFYFRLQVKKSFWRLAIPLVSWGLIASFFKFNAWEHIHALSSFTVSDSFLLLKKIFGFTVGFYWYISALLLCIFFGTFLYWITERLPQHLGIYILYSSVFLIPCIPLDLFHFSFFWPFYIMGSLVKNDDSIARLSNQIKRIPLVYMIVLSLGCVFLGYSFMPANTFYYASYNPVVGGNLVLIMLRYFFYWVSTLCAFIIFERIYCSPKRNMITIFVEKAGKESLFLYMAHMVILFHIYHPIIMMNTNSQGLMPNNPIVKFYIFSTLISVLLFVSLYLLSILNKRNRLINILLMGNYKIKK